MYEKLKNLVNATEEFSINSRQFCDKSINDISALIKWLSDISNIISKDWINETIFEGRSNEFEKAQWALELATRIKECIQDFKKTI